MSLLAFSGGTALLVAVPVLLALAGLLIFAVAHRRDTDAAIGALSRETVRRDRSELAQVAGVAEPSPTAHELERATSEAWRRPAGELAATGRAPVPYVPPDAEAVGVSRREFFNRSIVSLMGLGLTGFGLASVGFLWPTSSGGFGSKIKVGRLGEIRDKIAEGGGFAYYPEGRMWITEYPAPALEKARSVYPPPVLTAMEAGFAVLYQKCPHLGCRVPQCLTSQWFECPCHGSQYNRAGEKKGGPAPRGMDRFATTISADTLTVDTGTIFQGPPIGTNTTGQEAEGPHCVTGGGE